MPGLTPKARGRGKVLLEDLHPMKHPFQTADLSDAHPELACAAPIFRSYGGLTHFWGPIRTVVAPQDNTLVREALEEPGEGAILAVEGFGSTQVALLGDRLGELAVANGWAGLVIHGLLRDSEALSRLPLGIRALGTCPRRSEKRHRGERDVPLRFAGLELVPGQYLYVDPDGILGSPSDLLS